MVVKPALALNPSCRRSSVASLKPQNTTDSQPILGNLRLDPLALRVSVNGRIVPATVLEFRLLEYMARNPGQVFTRDQLLDAVWGEECFVTPRTVDACIRRIRTKIEIGRGCPSFLKTIRGEGYSLGNVSPTSRNTRR